MSRTGKILVVIICIAAALYGLARWAVGPFGTWRYKLTVEIETPEGVKSGFAVREVKAIHGIQITPESSPSVQVRGEAVVVDLGERGTVFALLGQKGGNTDAAKHVVFYTFPYAGGGLTSAGIRYYDGLIKRPRDVNENYIPLMVTFDDMNDPKTVREVYSKRANWGRNKPDHLAFDITDNFEEIFGEGVRLKSVTIEMVDEPVTWEIEKRLPWLPGRKYVRGALGGSSEKPFEDPTGLYLTGIEFSTGK